MPDIFVSYATPDRAQVKPIVDALKSRQWSTFWDRDLPSGKSWDNVLHGELDDARCVVVLWSRHSIVSEWVQHEASIARYRHVIVPAIIDPGLSIEQIPSRFRNVHIVRLSDAGALADAGLATLVSSVAQVLSRRRRHRWLIAAAPVCALAAAVGVVEAPDLALLRNALRADLRRIEYRGVDARARLGQRIRAGKSIKLLLPHANNFTQAFTNDFKNFFAKSNSTMTVLFATAESEFYRELLTMTLAPNVDEQAYKAAMARIEVSKHILMASATSGSRIQFRHFDTQFRLPMVIVDDRYCYLSVTLPPNDEAESLQLEFEGDRSGYVGTCLEHFESLWKISEPRPTGSVNSP